MTNFMQITLQLMNVIEERLMNSVNSYLFGQVLPSSWWLTNIVVTFIYMVYFGRWYANSRRMTPFLIGTNANVNNIAFCIAKTVFNLTSCNSLNNYYISLRRLFNRTSKNNIFLIKFISQPIPLLIPKENVF